MYTTVYLKTFPGYPTQQEILNSLSPKQLKFIKQYTYRCDVNPIYTTTVLNIRTNTDNINYSELLFLFPDAVTQRPRC